MRDSPTTGADHGLTYLIIAPAVTERPLVRVPSSPLFIPNSKRVERISLHAFSSIRSVFRCAPVHDLVILTLVGESARTKPLVRRTLREPGCTPEIVVFTQALFAPRYKAARKAPPGRNTDLKLRESLFHFTRANGEVKRLIVGGCASRSLRVGRQSGKFAPIQSTQARL